MRKLFTYLWKLLGIYEEIKKGGKAWYKSKTVWVNIIALVALVVQNEIGFKVSAEEQVAILAVVNLILRLLTKQPITWKEKSQ